MTAAEFRAALKSLGLRQLVFAERLGMSRETVCRWATGGLAVPAYASFCVDLLEQNAALRNRLAEMGAIVSDGESERG